MKRRFLIASGSLAAPALLLGSAHAQGVAKEGVAKEKDTRVIVGFERGGGADSVARAIAAQLQRRTSRRFSVDNRTGSSGAVPGEIVKKGIPDGSELALLSSTTLVSRLNSKDFPFDPTTDLTPLTKVGNFSIAFAVSPTLGINTFAEYVDWVKAGDPSRRRIAVSSNTTFVQVLNILLRRSIGQTLEPVNYRGVLPILSDMKDGRVPASVNTLTSLLPPHRGQRVKILMTTGTRRLSVAPNIPTAMELGYPTLDMEEWFAFFGPPGIPPAVSGPLVRRLRSTIDDPEMIDLLKPLGLEVETSTPEELLALMDLHKKSWQARMTNTGLAAAN
jgi:tripartite-type tricarboxylate transporter receptor subunit TctC